MSRTGPRLVLAFGTAAGLASGVALAMANPEQVGIATDVYYHAAWAFLSGGDVYAVRPPDHPAFGFLYPPIAVLVFVPHALTGSTGGAYALQTAINLLTAGAFAALLLVATERGGVDLDRVDRGLVVGYALGGYGTTAALVMGQVNVQLALGIGLGTLLLERGRRFESGIAFGVAAVVKPLLVPVGAWLLRRRATRAVLGATATGLAALLAGVLVLGLDPTVTYLTEVVPAEAATGSFAGVPDPGSPHLTIRRQLAYLAPGLSSTWRSVVGALLLLPLVVGTALSIATYRDRLVALAGTLLAILWFVPLEPFYLVLVVFPLVPLLYLLNPGWPRTLLLVGVVLLSAPVTMTSVELWAAFLPTWMGSAVTDVATTAFRFALPPTYGTWFALGGCLLHQWRQSSATSDPGR